MSNEVTADSTMPVQETPSRIAAGLGPDLVVGPALVHHHRLPLGPGDHAPGHGRRGVRLLLRCRAAREQRFPPPPRSFVVRAGENRDETPASPTTSSSDLRKVLTSRRSPWTSTSRRSRSRCSTRVGVSPIGAMETSSPPAQATCRSWLAGVEGQTARRRAERAPGQHPAVPGIDGQAPRPPWRRATCTRPSDPRSGGPARRQARAAQSRAGCGRGGRRCRRYRDRDRGHRGDPVLQHQQRAARDRRRRRLRGGRRWCRDGRLGPGLRRRRLVTRAPERPQAGCEDRRQPPPNENRARATSTCSFLADRRPCSGTRQPLGKVTRFANAKGPLVSLFACAFVWEEWERPRRRRATRITGHPRTAGLTSPTSVAPPPSSPAPDQEPDAGTRRKDPPCTRSPRTSARAWDARIGSESLAPRAPRASRARPASRAPRASRGGRPHQRHRGDEGAGGRGELPAGPPAGAGRPGPGLRLRGGPSRHAGALRARPSYTARSPRGRRPRRRSGARRWPSRACATHTSCTSCRLALRRTGSRSR